MEIVHIFFRNDEGIWGHHLPRGVMISGSVFPTMPGVCDGDGVFPGKDIPAEALELYCRVEVPADEVDPMSGDSNEYLWERKYAPSTVAAVKRIHDKEKERRDNLQHIR